MLRRPVGGALTALAVVLLAAGCGPANAGAVEATDYAKAVCATCSAGSRE